MAVASYLPSRLTRLLLALCALECFTERSTQGHTECMCWGTTRPRVVQKTQTDPETVVGKKEKKDETLSFRNKNWSGIIHHPRAKGKLIVRNLSIFGYLPVIHHVCQRSGFRGCAGNQDDVEI